MKFGGEGDPDRVDLGLPPDNPRNARVLGGEVAGDWLYLAAPAWSRRDWVGKLYPAGTAAKDYLREYARRLNAIELNGTFYQVPDERVVDGWYADTPAGFRFLPKFPKPLTHERRGFGDPALVTRFCTRMQRLGEKLGPALLALPPWFAPADLPALETLLAALPESFPVSVELRHPAWFHDRQPRDEVADLLEQRGAGLVVTDAAGRRDVCHATLSNRDLFLRFVGNSLHPTDIVRVDAWLDRLADWRARGLQRAFFVIHQPDDLVAPELLSALAQRARRRGIAVPPVELQPQQLGLL